MRLSTKADRFAMADLLMGAFRGLLLRMSVVGGRAENICSYRGFRILTQSGTWSPYKSNGGRFLRILTSDRLTGIYHREQETMVLELETETSFRAWTDSDELTSTDLAACGDPVRGRPNNDTTQYGEREGAEPKLGRLNVQGIEKSLAGRAILTNVSLYVQRGEVVTLFGPSGAGRSTLFHIVTGLVPADAGQIELDGQEISRLPMYRRARLGLAYVPQELPIYGSGLNSAHNVEFAAQRSGADNEGLATGTEAT
jgi:ABC-type multidrug transport system fused ATPase/permease subunit